MNRRNTSSQVSRWYCPPGQKPRPSRRRPAISPAIIKRFYQLIQSRHHLLIFQTVEETGVLPRAFQHKVDDLADWVHAPFLDEELNEVGRNSSERWARGVCEVLHSHYQLLYEEIKEELSGKYSSQEIEEYRKEAVKRARKQFTNRLKESTVLEFMALDFRPVDSTKNDNSSIKGRELDRLTVNGQEASVITHNSTCAHDFRKLELRNGNRVDSKNDNSTTKERQLKHIVNDDIIKQGDELDKHTVNEEEVSVITHDPNSISDLEFRSVDSTNCNTRVKRRQFDNSTVKRQEVPGITHNSKPSSTLDCRPTDSINDNTVVKGRQLDKKTMSEAGASLITNDSKSASAPVPDGDEEHISSIQQDMSCKIKFQPFVKFDNYRGLLLLFALLWFALILICV